LPRSERVGAFSQERNIREPRREKRQLVSVRSSQAVRAAADQRKAWHYIISLSRAEGATNVKWFRCPNKSGAYEGKLATARPGDEYVDSVGADGYVWSGGSHSGRQPSGARTTGSYNTTKTTRPFIRGKTGRAAGASVDKAQWIRDALLGATGFLSFSNSGFQ
jgi:hypothetical protein